MRLSGVARLGLDEHAWQRADAHRHTQFVTGIVALPCGVGRPARLLDIVPGRSGTVLGHRLAARSEPPPGPPRIEFKPGMANEMLRELGPLLAEEGIDVDNLEVDDIETLQRAMNRAVEQKNTALFTPVGARRDVAAAALRPGVVEAWPARANSSSRIYSISSSV